jgi:hypothetical protein
MDDNDVRFLSLELFRRGVAEPVGTSYLSSSCAVDLDVLLSPLHDAQIRLFGGLSGHGQEG